jgi:hypothetical protein
MNFTASKGLLTKRASGSVLPGKTDDRHPVRKSLQMLALQILSVDCRRWKRRGTGFALSALRSRRGDGYGWLASYSI